MKNFQTKNKLSQSFCDFPHSSFAEPGIKRESTLSTCIQDHTIIITEEVMVTNSLRIIQLTWLLEILMCFKFDVSFPRSLKPSKLFSRLLLRSSDWTYIERMTWEIFTEVNKWWWWCNFVYYLLIKCIISKLFCWHICIMIADCSLSINNHKWIQRKIESHPISSVSKPGLNWPQRTNLLSKQAVSQDRHFTCHISVEPKFCLSHLVNFSLSSTFQNLSFNLVHFVSNKLINFE